ncbi:uncharacterized protein LOC101239942 isoform X3 [Hydra vulgaris]|uniref:Uncharacterized protein LOC101239942 isoform X3 n=1 Tax=Hydra vulgaris TaxID=6087 RepID=A0ABM4CKB5_HYDVU
MQRKFLKYCLLIFLIVFIAIVAILYSRVNLKTNNPYLTHLSKDFDDTLKKRCFYRVFGDSLLLINFNFPFYKNIDVLNDLYDGVFGKIVFCGPPPKLEFTKKPDIEIDSINGYFSYHCLALAINKYPNYQGYFYGNDDMIINWWTMVDLDRQKIWHGTQIVDFSQDAFSSQSNVWIWWDTFMGLRACQMYFKSLKKLAENNNNLENYKIYLKNGNGKPRCGKGWADFFYIPGRLAKDFFVLSNIAYSSKLYLEIATHNILRSLTLSENFVVLAGIYLPDIGYANYSVQAFWSVYNHQVPIIHPYKFYVKDAAESTYMLKTQVISFKQLLTDCSYSNYTKRLFQK